MQKYLLDTHIVIWLAREPERLSVKVIETLENKENQIYFSAINLWEIALKNSLHRQDFDFDVTELRKQLVIHGFEELAIYGRYAQVVAKLPFYHKDPFDRMLIAQAMSENLCLITDDGKIKQYQDVILLD